MIFQYYSCKIVGILIATSKFLNTDVDLLFIEKSVKLLYKVKSILQLSWRCEYIYKLLYFVDYSLICVFSILTCNGKKWVFEEIKTKNFTIPPENTVWTIRITK